MIQDGASPDNLAPVESTTEAVSVGARAEPFLEAEFDRVIAPTRGLPSFRLREVWEFRELLYFLTWRDIKVRYKQTALGVVWAILQPVLSMVIFTLVFTRVAPIGTGGIPYPIFSFSGLVPWLFFANSVLLASNSLIVNPQLISKIYFPRIFLVVSPVFAGLVDFALAFVVLIGLMVYYGISPNPEATILLVPLMVLAFATAVGVSAWLSALNVKYRDVKFVVPFLIQFWFFATPVVYPISSLGEPWKSIYGINPMASVVEGFRWALADGPPLDGITTALSVVSGIALLFAGLFYFYRTEKRFADVI